MHSNARAFKCRVVRHSGLGTGLIPANHPSPAVPEQGMAKGVPRSELKGWGPGDKTNQSTTISHVERHRRQ